ncbi:Hypothetical protein A7982_05025 [Minicystis rosea]|nr:Hypothetical protein A7982_05025 [Minicystis rosea]
MTAVRGRTWLRVAVVFAVLAITGLAQAGRWVIPPGQEALVGRMLGGDLPGGCRFAGASLEKTQVLARYACPAGEGRLMLRHPSDARDAVVRSQQLAVVVATDAPVPAALVTALGERLRAEESAWRWMAEGRSLGRTMEEAGLSARTRKLVVPLGAAAAVAFAATLAVALAIARWMARRSPPAETSAKNGLDDLRAAAVTIAAAFAFLKMTYPAAPVHADTTRDLLMAADCLTGHGCDHGPPTTLGVIVQGALWTRWLALGRTLGLGIGAVQTATHALFALSAGVVLLSARRRFGRDLGWLAAALYVIGAATLLDVPILWNPSLAPLPLAIFHALLVELAWDRDGDGGAARSIALAAGAAFGLALAIDCHVLFAVLVPVLFAAIAGSARRPWAATVTAAVVLTGTLLVDSRTAWRVNARAFVDAGAALPLAAMVVLAAVCAAIARPQILALPPRWRAFVFVGAATIYTTGATIALFAVLGPAAGHRYLVPAVPGLALCAAALVRAGARRAIADVERVTAVGAAIALVVTAGVRRTRAPIAAEWTVAEVEAIAGEVYRRAPSYREVLGRTRARTPVVVPALGIFEPRTPAQGGDPREEILLFSMAKDLAPRRSPSLTVMDLGARAVVIAGVQPFLERSRAMICFAPRAFASEEMGCADGNPAREASGPESPEERAYPALSAAREVFPPEVLRRFGGLRQTVSMPVRATPGAAHRVVLLDASSGYRIEKVTGVKSRGALPGMQVTIESGEGRGELLIGREDGGEERGDRYWIPMMMEVPEDDAELLRLIEDARVR